MKYSGMPSCEEEGHLMALQIFEQHRATSFKHLLRGLALDSAMLARPLG